MRSAAWAESLRLSATAAEPMATTATTTATTAPTTAASTTTSAATVAEHILACRDRRDFGGIAYSGARVKQWGMGIVVDLSTTKVKDEDSFVVLLIQSVSQ